MYPRDFFRDPPTVTAGSCFVLMPFAAEMRPVYDAIAEALQSPELAFTCKRADELFGGGHIIKDILEGIASAELVVADVTSRNPNVFYELGIAHTTKEIDKVLIITQSVDDVPFDLRQFRFTVYDPTPEGLRRLQRALIESARKVSAGSFRFYVEDGKPYLFPHRLPGEGRFLYDFEIVAYTGLDSVKGRIDVRRHGVEQQNERVVSEGFGLEAGESVPIPHLRWELHLHRAGGGTALLSVRAIPRTGSTPQPVPPPVPDVPRASSATGAENAVRKSPPEAGGALRASAVPGIPATASSERAVAEVSFKDYVVRELQSGAIEVLRGGVPIPAKDTRTVLVRIAFEINAGDIAATAPNSLTRQLGRRVIERIGKMERT